MAKVSTNDFSDMGMVLILGFFSRYDDVIIRIYRWLVPFFSLRFDEDIFG
jgi:hypothetical protein